MIDFLKTENLLDTSQTIATELFEDVNYPWEVLPKIKEFILNLGPTLPKDKFEEISKNVWVSKDANVFASAYIGGPTIICSKAEIRHAAFIRSSAIVGENCVVGNSTELKNVILFNCVQVPHYNYVGDSVLGYKAHLGAGAITSNVKSDKSLVCVNVDQKKVPTGLKKFGAIVGNNVEVGCNTVLNPGCVVGQNTSIYPLSTVRGFVVENSIYKSKDNVVRKTKDF